MAKGKRYTIVLGWAEKDGLVPTGGHVERDRNLVAEFRLDWKGRAAMWRNDGCYADVKKAKAYAATETAKGDYTVKVYTYETSEQEPLERTRKAAASEAARLESGAKK